VLQAVVVVLLADLQWMGRRHARRRAAGCGLTRKVVAEGFT